MVTPYNEYNVSFALLAGCAKWQDEVAISAGDFRVGYAEFAHLVISTARHMQRHGGGPDATIGVASDDPLFVLASVYATGLIGARWIAAHGSDADYRAAGITLLLQDSWHRNERLAGAVPVDETWAHLPDGAENADAFPGYSSPDDVWIITRTSGTTDQPKMVALSHRVVSARITASAELISRPGGKIAGLGPVESSPLLIPYLTGLSRGAEIVTGVTPEEIERLGVDLVFGTPVQASRFMEGHVFARKAPRMCLLGETAHEGLICHLLKSFSEVMSTYGATEAHDCAYFFWSIAEGGPLSRSTAICDCDLEVVDEHGRRLPPGEQGILRIRSDRLAPGYLGAPELTERSFKEGWFYPGDLGRLTSKGELFVAGRMNDRFQIDGSWINPALLDQTMKGVAGVRDAMAFMLPVQGGPDRLMAFVAIEPGTLLHDVRRSIRIAMLRLGNPALIPQDFLLADVLPRTGTGGPNRNACVAAVLARQES